MNKFAEIKYGMVVEVYEDERDLEHWRTLFVPRTNWVEVTGMDVEKGDRYVLVDGAPTFVKSTKPTKPVTKGTITKIIDENKQLKEQVAELNDVLLEMMFNEEE